VRSEATSGRLLFIWVGGMLCLLSLRSSPLSPLSVTSNLELRKDEERTRSEAMRESDEGL